MTTPAPAPQPQPQPATIVNVVGAQQTKGPNHVLHALLTIFTAGFWLPVWIVIAMRNKRRPI